MKIMTTLALASVALAIPMDTKTSKRQSTGSTANDFKRNGCNDIIFIWARGSAEIGNMVRSCLNPHFPYSTLDPDDPQGTIVGPDVADNLKEEFPGQVAVQGVDYAALLSTNFLPGGTGDEGIVEMKSLLSDSMSQCPDSIIVAGGYS